ncbi:MAG TPA: hypothetical protein VER39_08580 [Nocardioidaceae bacterium]|nr:hypothetical protein [Nocardioidaceae bacterium]
MMSTEPFLSAEIDYRRRHLAEQYARGGRLRLPRRPSLHLPRPRRRPLALA